MAQAARLNLRMQKELKILLTDPPHGASFPSLSDSSSSLTSIHAHFQGPEGTVYANGVFKIQIQIPERYPFQPPIVTFDTPIYHPNIDNGGRICLDILNLPPKGSWQPSLNISTVLTSIGLLLSEPNPDDGLMHEASREYKYNRQAFDQKARTMTEKYARAGECESSSRGNDDSDTHTGPSTTRTENEGPNTNQDSVEDIYKVPVHDYVKNPTETEQTKEAKGVVTGYNINPDILKTSRSKLSLKVPVVSCNRSGEITNLKLPNQCPSFGETKSVASSGTSSMEVDNGQNQRDENDRKSSLSTSASQEQPSINCVKTSQSRGSSEKLHILPQHDVPQLNSSRHNKTNHHKEDATTRENVDLGRSIPSSGPLGRQHNLENEKENMAPPRCLPPITSLVVSENGLNYNERTGKQAAKALKLPKMAVKLPFKPLDQLLGSNNNIIMQSENPSSLVSNNKKQINEVHVKGYSTGKLKGQCTERSPIPSEAVIVLDSEDSEDENVAVRSKLSLGRRCLSRKRKSAI